MGEWCTDAEMWPIVCQKYDKAAVNKLMKSQNYSATFMFGSTAEKCSYINRSMQKSNLEASRLNVVLVIGVDWKL